MLRRYENWSGFTEDYSLSLSTKWTSDGIFDTNLIETKDSIIIPNYGKVKKSVLVALVGKKSMVPIYCWRHLDTLPLDGNESNIELSNLIWSSSSKMLTIKSLVGYRFIPGYSRYLINEKGEIFNFIMKIKMKPYLSKNGYMYYGLTPDIGLRSVLPTHRLLCLAFKEYPANVHKLEVNHKDGNKLNNDLSNLEWVTPRENIIHAVKNGLRTDNKEIEVRNSYSGEVIEYFSIAEAARVHKVSDETITNRSKKNGKSVYYPGYQFRFKSNDEWYIPKDIVSEIQKTRQKIKIRYIDTINDVNLIFDSIGECAKYSGLKSATISYRLKHNNGKVVKNIILERLLFE